MNIYGYGIRPQADNKPATEKRWYYKCPECLCTVVLKGLTARRDLVCGVCGEYLYTIGEVTAENKWVRKEEKCKCDGRCINALGPSCDCSCGGENHGSGMDGFVEVVAETGEVKLTPSHDIEKHKQWAKEYNDAYDAAESRIKAKHGQAYEFYKSKQRLAYDTWWEIKKDLTRLGDAADLKVHKTRIAKLNKVCA